MDDVIRKYADQWGLTGANSVGYLCGHPEMVEQAKGILKRIGFNKENLKEEVRDVGDEAERATRETENSLELRTRDRYRKLIGKIDDALKRIDDGVYGYCVDTGDEIGQGGVESSYDTYLRGVAGALR